MNNFYQNALAEYGIGGAHPGGLQQSMDVLDKVEILKGMSVLDVGCGTGQTAAYIAKTYGADVTAIDIHPLMVEKAEKRFKQQTIPVTVMEADVTTLPFADEQFDFIIAESVLAFTDIPKSLKEIYRVLKTNGTFISLDMTAEKILQNKVKKTIKELYNMPDIYTQDEWIDLFHDAQFLSIDILSAASVATLVASINSIDHAPEFDISDDVSPEATETLAKHQLLMQTHEHDIGMRVFKSVK